MTAPESWKQRRGFGPHQVETNTEVSLVRGDVALVSRSLAAITGAEVVGDLLATPHVATDKRIVVWQFGDHPWTLFEWPSDYFAQRLAEELATSSIFVRYDAQTGWFGYEVFREGQLVEEYQFGPESIGIKFALGEGGKIRVETRCSADRDGDQPRLFEMTPAPSVGVERQNSASDQGGQSRMMLDFIYKLGTTFDAQPPREKTMGTAWDLDLSDRGFQYRFRSTSRSPGEHEVKGGYGFLDAVFRSEDAFLPDLRFFPKLSEGAVYSSLPRAALAGVEAVLLPHVTSHSLFEAIRAGDLATVCLLIEIGADVDESLEEDGPTPVELAQDLGHTEILSALLEAGANPDVLDGI
jgi:hypothetical protein